MRKIIQISTATLNGSVCLVALCDDASVWVQTLGTHSPWVRVNVSAVEQTP